MKWKIRGSTIKLQLLYVRSRQYRKCTHTSVLQFLTFSASNFENALAQHKFPTVYYTNEYVD